MERWSSQFGFVLAAIGAAVGLGNLWRFSAVVGQNGGGAYLVPYLLAAFVLAVPLLVLELVVGRSLRTDVVSAFRSVDERFTPLGWVVVGGVVLILSYYLVLTGWVLAFFVAALGDLPLTFAGFTDSWWPVAAFVVTTILTGVVIRAGVRGGIERLARVAMPLVFAIVIALAIFAATLDGFGAAVEFLFTPDTSVLGDPAVWSAAVGQVFFSLSVGQGIMLTYGAYLDDATPIVRSALVIAVADILVAIVAGLVIFPVVFTFGLQPAAGTELAFTTLPRAFAELGTIGVVPVGRLVAVGFFGLLFVAALTSGVSLLEVGVAATRSTTGWTRERATMVLTGLVFVLGLPSALSYSTIELTAGGLPILDLVDESVGTFALPVSALLLLGVFVWHYKPALAAIRAELGVVTPVLQYVLPVALVVVTGLKALGVAIPAWSALITRTTLRSEVVFIGILVVLATVGYFLRHRGRSRRFRRLR